MKRGLFLQQNPPSPGNVHFPLEVLKAAYEFLQAGIDSDHVLFCYRRSGQEAHYEFRKTSDLLGLQLPGNTTYKLWQLIRGGYDRTRLIPTAFLCDGFCWVILLDTHKLFVERG